MAIKRIVISNFKSFDTATINLDKFNIIIGANAAGKSNVIRVFEFLHNIVEFNLEDAISMQGGLEYLVNANIGSLRDFSLEITTDARYVFDDIRFEKRKNIIFCATENKYGFSMKLSKGLNKYWIADDKLTIKGQFYVKERRAKGQLIGDAELVITREKGKFDFNWISVPEEPLSNIKPNQVFEFFMAVKSPRRNRLGANRLMLETVSFQYCAPEMYELLGNISIYDFDPKLTKRAQQISGLSTLEYDGSNLATIVGNILKNRSKTREFYNLLRDLLPPIEKIRIQPVANSVMLQIKEKYSPKQYFPGFLISDGTINLTALVIALYFEDNEIAVIEEPERNIHPYLISKLVAMMRDSSNKKQIITTTHNPEVVRHADPKEILLITRSDSGYSEVIKPAEKEDVKAFLENDMGLEELYVQNLLNG